MNEKSINISLTKIFNYPEEEQKPTLSIAFYSKKTQSLITKKATHCTCLNKCLNLCINLKINYTSQQNCIIVMVEDIVEESQDRQNFIFVGESQIDLDELQEKKIKYFNIGGDKILQVEAYEARKPKRLVADNHSDNFLSPLEERQKFLKDRKKFLEKIRDTQAVLKKNFSQKIYQLINDSRSLRQERNVEDNQDVVDSQRSPPYETEMQECGESKLKKSRSDNALANFRGRGFFTSPTPVQEQRKQSKESQKQKLMLNTLNAHQTNSSPTRHHFRQKH